MDAATILNTLDDIGVSVQLNGDRLRMKPKDLIPPDLMSKVKEHKQELILHLSQVNQTDTPSPRVIYRLERAITQKEEDLTVRRWQLSDPDCHNPEWCKHQIVCMQGHITEIKRYIKEGSQLTLPRCCQQHAHYCLIAMRGFDACLMTPEDCGFSLKP